MCDAFVAVDAGFIFFDSDGVAFAGALFLNCEVHIVKVVTVAAFTAVSFLPPIGSWASSCGF